MRRSRPARTRAIAVVVVLVVAVGVLVGVLATRGGGGGSSSRASEPSTSASPQTTVSGGSRTPASPTALHQALLQTPYPSELLPPGWGYQATWANGKSTEGVAPFLPAASGNTFHFVGHALFGFQLIADPNRQVVVDFEVLADDASAQALLAEVGRQGGAAVNGGLTCVTSSGPSPAIEYCQQRDGNVVIVAAPSRQASVVQQTTDTAQFVAPAEGFLARVNATLG